MRKLFLIAPLLVVALAGCATGPSLAERMSQFVGQPERVLVQDLGVPSRSMTMGGVTYLAYIRSRTQYVPGSYGWGGFYGPFYGPAFGGFPPQIIHDWCETTFAVTKGLVRSFTLHGDACS